jgi:hypothetical protein
MSVTEKKTRSTLTIDNAFSTLLNWSEQGCTATAREAIEFLQPLTDAELVELNTEIEGHYTWLACEVEHEFYNGCEVGGLSGDEAARAFEEMHDAFRARSLISCVYHKRTEKAEARKPSEIFGA